MSTSHPLPASPLIVQKYGGATLADPEKIRRVAARICGLQRSGARVVVVVSAMGQTTNQLIELAHQVSPRPSLREMDMLLTVGERISMSLLSMALNDLGCQAISFTGSQAGILTDDAHVNANILDVRAHRVEESLAQGKVVILAGFQGVSVTTKEITTLGRGGSDISAVAMSGYLKADRCEILKDVDSVYTADPKLVPGARPLSRLNYHHLLEMTSWGAKVLHHHSVRLAAEKGVTLYVGAAEHAAGAGTLVTHDIHFSNQFLLAINSFAQVLHLELPGELEDLQRELQKNQIARVAPLHRSGTHGHYVTAPSEILRAILDYLGRPEAAGRLLTAPLCSVSATFSQPVEEKDLVPLQNLLRENRVEVRHAFHTRQSLHFFVAEEHRSAAVQALHSLI